MVEIFPQPLVLQQRFLGKERPELCSPVDLRKNIGPSLYLYHQFIDKIVPFLPFFTGKNITEKIKNLSRPIDFYIQRKFW